MLMMRRNRALIFTGAAVLLAGAAIAWFVGSDDGVRKGVGPFAAEMTRCRDRVFQELRYPDPIEYIEDTVWHSRHAEPDRFTIGGLVRLRGGNAQPFVHSYECESDGGEFVRVEIR